MIDQLLKNYYKKIAIVIAIVALLLISTTSLLYIDYHDSKKSLYLNIDKILQTTANDANICLGNNFHNRAVDKDSISENEDMKHIKCLSKFTNKINNVEYVYTMIQKDGDIYFTSSSATNEEINNKEMTRYFDIYDEATPLLKNVLKNNKIVFEESTDQWGTFRTIFIPYITKKGVQYILGADIRIDFIQKQLDEYITKSAEALMLLVILLIILILFFIKISKRELQEIKNLKENLESEIKERTQDLTIAKKEIEDTHKHTRESIEYASLIQGAVMSQAQDMQPFFKDHFVTWEPKDTVGGDIWLFNELRHEDECLLFFIDCTGHGVPGAFVTMIVKAIEREIVANLKKNPNFDISPAIIMSRFNKTMKTLLKQEDRTSVSNAGWDGGIIYYNRRTQILKFAGAETPLFYIDENGEFKTIKGNRYSVGYKKCAMDYEYKETLLTVQEGMKFYCTTDGYLDQNGGEKDFPFGKKRFSNIIQEHHEKSMAEIQTLFMKEMREHENAIEKNDRNDDMTVIGFEIGAASEYHEEEKEEIVKYEGVMTQNVIASCMDNIELKITNMNTLGVVSTITIEYCQNMMNYSKNEEIGSRQIVPAGEIEVQYINNEYYHVIATNVVSIEDKEKLEPKLIEIQGLDKQDIKKRYKELRKSGQNTHKKGGGIGVYEIAKVSDSIEYKFTKINEDKYRFTMKSFVKPKAKEI